MRAALTAVALVVIRPDVLLICVPAGLAIGGGGLGVTGDWIAAAIFVAIAASSVAIPILAYAAAGHRLDDTLVRVKDWMDKNNAALMAAILIVVVIVPDGIGPGAARLTRRLLRSFRSRFAGPEPGAQMLNAGAGTASADAPDGEPLATPREIGGGQP